MTPEHSPSSHAGATSVLPEHYRDDFTEMLGAVAAATADLDLRLVPFWPLRGAGYDQQLLVVGRSVNGWVDDWSVGQLRDKTQREAAVAWLQADAEPADRDRMAWVSDLWGAASGYSTRRSAFWRVLRRISAGDAQARDGWPGRLVWTNLYKVSPAAGWNPGADLQRVQRRAAIALLEQELEAFAPRRVLALTGNWITPMRELMGLRLEERHGLVEGVGERAGQAWVVAKHPMGKPEGPFVTEVLGAFADLGAPIG